MVLNEGAIVEMDAPTVLLNKEGGTFRQLWEKHKQSHN